MTQALLSVSTANTSPPLSNKNRLASTELLILAPRFPRSHNQQQHYQLLLKRLKRFHHQQQYDKHLDKQLEQPASQRITLQASIKHSLFLPHIYPQCPGLLPNIRPVLTPFHGTSSSENALSPSRVEVYIYRVDETTSANAAQPTTSTATGTGHASTAKPSPSSQPSACSQEKAAIKPTQQTVAQRKAATGRSHPAENNDDNAPAPPTAVAASRQTNGPPAIAPAQVPAGQQRKHFPQQGRQEAVPRTPEQRRGPVANTQAVVSSPPTRSRTHSPATEALLAEAERQRSPRHFEEAYEAIEEARQ